MLIRTTRATCLAFLCAALLSGPDEAPRWLRRHGGLFILYDGTVIHA